MEPGRLDIAFTRANDWHQLIRFRVPPAGSTVATRISGSGAPAPSRGSNGDYYIDGDNDVYYGPKTGGVWGSSHALEPIDYSAFTFLAQLRKSEDAADAADCTIDSSGLAAGDLIVGLPHDLTGPLERVYAWDLLMIDPDDFRVTPLAGDATVRLSVTQVA